MYRVHTPNSEDIDNLDFAALRVVHLLSGELELGSDFDDYEDELPLAA